MNRIDRILQAAVLPDVPVESLPEARQAGILNGTMQLVQQDAKKHGRKRVIRIMIAAAAAIAVLCGAAAVLHYASVSNAKTTYHAEGASIRPDGTLEPFSYDFSRDAIIRVDTEGRTSGTYCGVQFGWTPTALIPDNTAYLYDVIAMRSPAQLDGISDAQMELAKDCVYSTDSTAQVRFTFSCLSANEVAGCDLLVPGDDPAIVKEGMLNDLYACWIETYDTDRGADITHHFLLLYDADKLCVVFLGGDWDVTEKIAEHMTIVQTGIPTPEASQNFTYVGVFGWKTAGPHEKAAPAAEIRCGRCCALVLFKMAQRRRPSPAMRAVISSSRSSGNGGSHSGFMAILMSFMGLSSAATRLELSAPQRRQRWMIAHSPPLRTQTATGSMIPPQSDARSPGSRSTWRLERQLGQWLRWSLPAFCGVQSRPQTLQVKLSLQAWVL